ncbi:MAG: tetratricopeptide repeat protein [Acidobacteriota bacterium]|nr:tetratricopeptide repeat protein [Acidobacteriota bacterium]
MNLQECPRARTLRVLPAVLLALFVALAASCTSPEKAKAEHLRRGEQFLKDRKWQDASLEFRAAIQIDDNLAAAHWGLARAYEQLGRGGEFIEELQRTIRLDPNNAEARVKLASAYLAAYSVRKNDTLLAEAERLAGEITARDPKNPDGLILTANVIYFKGNGSPEAAKQAEQKINDAINLNPQRVESYMGKARLYQLMNRADLAESVYKQAISINDRSSLAHVEYGKFLTQTDRSDQAEAEFRKAVEVDPENRDVRWVLASYYLVHQKLDQAEPAYSAWAHLDWDKAEGRARLADYYATVGRFDDAANLYQDIIKSFPDYARGHYRLGEISLQRGDQAGARAQVEELLKRNQKDPDALFLRARMSEAAGKYKDAIADLKTVLDSDPRSKLGLYFMADALYRDGQLEQARARAAELERYYVDTQEFLPAKLLQIQISLDSGDFDGAKRMADDLVAKLKDKTPSGELTPQLLADLKTNVFILRGKANLGLGQRAADADVSKFIAAARADFEQARQLAPNSPMPYVNLADVAAAEKKPDEAQQQLERALSLDRTNFQALTALINLSMVTGHLDQARQRVEQLASEQPTSAPLQYLVGQAYRTGSQQQPPDPQRAEAAFQRAVQQDPDYMAAYSALAEIYVALSTEARAQNRQEDASRLTDQAVGQYKKITEKRQDDFIAYRNIGLIEAQRNNLDVAVDYYHRVLSIRPDEPVAENNLAMLYVEHDKVNAEEAMRLAQDVVRRFPGEPGFADTLGQVYLKKGLYRDAVEQLQKVVAVASRTGHDNSLYRWHLGQALAAAGDKQGARRELQKCQELYAQEQQRAVKSPTATPIEDVRRTLESL